MGLTNADRICTRFKTIRRFRGRPRPEPAPNINEKLLKIKEVRLIGADNSQLGVMSTREALNLAQQAELDLVLVAPAADPPVAKIVDYGRWKYEQEKTKKENKKKTQEVKGITLRPNTAEHDLMVLVRKALQFLGEGDKVRVVCRFKQRELAHPEVGAKKLEFIANNVEEVGKRDKDPVLSGREMVMVLNPRPAGKQKNAKAEDQQNSGEEV